MRTKKPIHQARVDAEASPWLIEREPIPTNRIPVKRISKAFRFIQKL
jgi:hypothetical protein